MSNAQLAECTARLNVSLQDIKMFYEEAQCAPEQIENLNSLIETHEPVKFLELSEGFSHCMAFIDHDKIIRLLMASWNLQHDCINIERKIVSKKLRNLEGDKNSDPEIILKLTNSKSNIDKRKATAVIHCAKLSYMLKFPIQKFLDDTAYNPAGGGKAFVKAFRAGTEA
jgi:hypothetical protein